MTGPKREPVRTRLAWRIYLVGVVQSILVIAGFVALIWHVRPGEDAPLTVGWLILGLLLVIVGITSWLLSRSIARPLARLSAAARSIGSGNLDARVGVDRNDELGDVAQAFDEMADQLRELLQAEKQLVANVSHELRTPLARIRVALDLASEGDHEVARESLKEIAGDLDDLERLVSDVLTASRLDLADASPRAIPPVQKERIDVAEWLNQTADRFRRAHPKRPLDFEISADLPAIEGDPVLLRRALDNLLQNAHKYTEQEDLPIRLAGRSDSRVQIEVIDYGIGIASADMSGVFRPFFRADQSRTRMTGGTGLGLALAKRIVEAHGGTIELESSVGEGTIARVRLPTSDQVEPEP